MSTDLEARILRIDGVADSLLDLIENKNVGEGEKGISAAQKASLFAQIIAWYKIREKLLPSGNGSRLKEMVNEQSKNPSGGSGSTGSHSSRAAAKPPTGDGKAIKAIIRSLPPFGGDTLGNKGHPKRKSRGDAGDGGSIPINGGSDDHGDVDGARHVANL
jgi:hypothetical protein